VSDSTLTKITGNLFANNTGSIYLLCGGNPVNYTVMYNEFLNSALPGEVSITAGFSADLLFDLSMNYWGMNNYSAILGR